MKYALKGTKIVIYGAASYGKRMYERFVENGLDVIAFVDKRADELGTFMDRIVIRPEQLNEKLGNSDYILFIAIKNVFEHSKIVQQFIVSGHTKIIYRPYSTLMGRGSAEQGSINRVYDKIDENEFGDIFEIPAVYEDNMLSFNDNAIIRREGEEVIANIPWQFVFTNKKRDGGSIWSDVNCMQMFPQISFFSYLLGNRSSGINDYLNFCISAASKQGDIEITEQWKENVITNRDTIFQQMNHAYELDWDFFVRNAPSAEWNEERNYFNLNSGKHRTAFLLARGNKYIPIRLSSDDYSKYIKMEYAQKVATLNNKLMSYRILHPRFLEIPCKDWDVYDLLEKCLVEHITKTYLFSKDTLALKNKTILIGLPDDNGSVSRTFALLGMNVTRFMFEKDDISPHIEKLFKIENKITVATNYDEVRNMRFDFGLMDSIYMYPDQENSSFFSSLCAEAFYCLADKGERTAAVHEESVIMEGIWGRKTREVIAMN